MKWLKMISCLCFIFFLVSCTATPKINIKSAGIDMEVTEVAPIVISAAISPNGKYIASSGVRNYNIWLWDLSKGTKLKQLVGHTDIVGSMTFSPDNQYVLSRGGDKTVRFWNLETGKELWKIELPSCLKDFNFLANVTFLDDKEHIATEDRCKGFGLWDVKTGHEIRRLGDWRTLSISPNGKHIVAWSGRYDGAKIQLIDSSTGVVRKELFDGSKYWVAMSQDVTFTSDSKYVAASISYGFHQEVYVWNTSTGKEIMKVIQETVQGIPKLVFSPDGRYLVGSGPGVRVWDISTGKDVRRFQGVSGFLMGYSFAVALSSDGKYLASSGSDASTRLWDFASGKEIGMMIAFEDGEWIVMTPEGYYNASEKGGQRLVTKIGKDSYGIDKFYDVFYRPDIVSAKLRGEDIGGLVTITMQDAIKSPPPVVEFTSKISNTDQPKVKVCYQVKSAGGGIGEVRLFHNGKLIQSDGYYREMAKSESDKTQLASLNSRAIYEDMRSIKVKGIIDTTVVSQTKGDVVETCTEVEAIPGENEMSVTAFNKSNTVQSYMKTINFHSNLKPEEPHLYILSVGIDRYRDEKGNLKYAVKDAGDIQDRFLKQSKTLYRPNNIHHELLTNEQATKENITRKIDELSKTIKPQDGFILFVAGHGVLLQNQYYMLTHDFNGQVSDTNMISSNEIVEMSKKIKSLSQLFIFDTCHAGGVDTIVSGLYDARMSVLAKKMGLHIYASASDKQAAMDGYKGNGLFTYSLLDGLNNNRQADKYKDGKVSIVGLGEYSKKMTTNISKQIGHEQTPLIINFGKDSPLYKLQ